MEDYVKDKGKPFDKYTKFKKQSIKQKYRIGNLLDNLKKVVSDNEKFLHIYTMKLKSKNYSKLRKKK